MALATVNFSKLPPPDAIATLNYEVILQAMLDALAILMPTLAPRLTLESEPIVKLAQLFASHELGLRQHSNDQYRATMLAYAKGNNLDVLAANYGVVRLVVDAGDPLAVPPRSPVLEADDAFRERIRLGMYIRTSAGPVQQYRYYALSAIADVRDVSVTSPVAGDVLISVLAQNGTPSQATLDAVLAVCRADDVRPLTDHVFVQPAQVINYAINCSIIVYPGFDATTIQQNCMDNLNAYAADHFKIGHDIMRSAIIAAAGSVAGVQATTVISPVNDLVIDDVSAPMLQNITVNIVGEAV